MALHDWAKLDGWEGVHQFWMHEITRDLKANLPPGYRAIVGASPLVLMPENGGKPDVAVSQLMPRPEPSQGVARSPFEPDYQATVTFLEQDLTLSVTRSGRVVAVVELISPRNKDRNEAREQYGNRYLAYLRNGVNVFLVDVHRRPANFSFSQYIAAALELPTPLLPTPSVVSYGLRGPAAAGGRWLDLWQRPLAVGEPLPALPLALHGDDRVVVNLDATYTRAAADNYLE